MKVRAMAGSDEIATVYIAELEGGALVEFVESVQPPVPRAEKWVLILSTLIGCPAGCRFCDAGGSYAGKVSAGEMLEQIDFMVRRRYPDGRVPASRFKVQFARMGEPSLNDGVIEVLEKLPLLYDAPGLIPALSTIAPAGREAFFERLLEVKKALYPGMFQLQFSIHTTDAERRDWLMPPKKWTLPAIASYGERFFDAGGRKVTLNFALAEGMAVDPGVLLDHFSPEIFLVKMTPVNPTCRAGENGLSSGLDVDGRGRDVAAAIEEAGYEVIVSIGELEENRIGSNCGQYIGRYLGREEAPAGSYIYEIREVGSPAL
jgi:23S rRNA (adenine2503-C2)-methyltransferase